MDKVGIIGAGSWGTALSLVLANNGHSVEIWSIVKEEIDMLKEKHAAAAWARSWWAFPS